MTLSFLLSNPLPMNVFSQVAWSYIPMSCTCGKDHDASDLVGQQMVKGGQNEQDGQ